MRRSTPAALVAAATFTLASCSFGEPPEPEAGQPPNLPTPSEGAPQEPASFLNVVAENLEVPWGMGFLPDGAALIGERDTGRILMITVAEDGTLSDPEEAYVVEGIDAEGDGACSDWPSPRIRGGFDRLRLLHDRGGQPGRRDRPLGRGRTRADPDRYPVGAVRQRRRARLRPRGEPVGGHRRRGERGTGAGPRFAGGKILSITVEGEPAEGNPDSESPVYSSGHHNIQGLAWNPDGQLFASEFGGDLADEINMIEAGGNYGWPVYEGPAGDEDYLDPVAYWEPFEASCSGAVFAEQTLITACLRGQRLWIVEFDSNGAVSGEPRPTLEAEFGRLRSVAMGPDGMLWLTTSNRDGECVAERGCTADETDDRVLRFATAYAAEGRI
ncbi:PQQ-dependent sugar dehydrogenase [Glycomyces albus]